MQKPTDQEKENLKHKDDAFTLEDVQKKKAVDLHVSEAKTARTLDKHNRKDAADLLGNDREFQETAAEARHYAATTLADAHDKAAIVLEDSQAKAAKALKDSQLEAALALQKALHQKE